MCVCGGGGGGDVNNILYCRLDADGVCAVSARFVTVEGGDGGGVRSYGYMFYYIYRNARRKLTRECIMTGEV